MYQEAGMEVGQQEVVGPTEPADQSCAHQLATSPTTVSSAAQLVTGAAPQFVTFDPATEFPTYDTDQQTTPYDPTSQSIAYDPTEQASDPIQAAMTSDRTQQAITLDLTDLIVDFEPKSQPIAYDPATQPIAHGSNDLSAQPISYDPNDPSSQSMTYDPISQPMTYDPDNPASQPTTYDPASQPMPYDPNDPSPQSMTCDPASESLTYDLSNSPVLDDSVCCIPQPDTDMQHARFTVMDQSEFQQFTNAPSSIAPPATYAEHLLPSCSDSATTPDSSPNPNTTCLTLPSGEVPMVTPAEDPMVPLDKNSTVAPDENSIVTPDENTVVAPDENPNITLDEHPKATPDENPNATPDENPKVTPDENSIVTPDENLMAVADNDPAHASGDGLTVATDDIDDDCGGLSLTTESRGPALQVTTVSGPHEEIVPSAAPASSIFKTWLMHTFGGESVVDVLPTLSRISGRSTELIKEATCTTEEEPAAKTDDSGAEAPKKVEDAVSYVNEIKTTYRTQPRTFSRFLCLLRDFKLSKMGLDNVMREINELFKENPHLISGFDQFLPANKRKDKMEMLDENEISPADLFCLLFYGHHSPALPLLVPPPPKIMSYGYPEVEKSYLTRSRSVWSEDEDLNLSYSEIESDSEMESELETDYEEVPVKRGPGRPPKHATLAPSSVRGRGRGRGGRPGQARGSLGMQAAARLTNKAKRTRIDEERVNKYAQENGVSYEVARRYEINRVFLARRLQSSNAEAANRAQRERSNSGASDTNDPSYTGGINFGQKTKRGRRGRGQGRAKGLSKMQQWDGDSDSDGPMSQREIARLKSIEYRKTPHGIEVNRKYNEVRKKRLIEKRAIAYAAENRVSFQKAEKIIIERMESGAKKRAENLEKRLKAYAKDHNVTYDEAKYIHEEKKRESNNRAKQSAIQNNAKRHREVKERTRKYVQETGLHYDEARKIIMAQVAEERKMEKCTLKKRGCRGGRRKQSSSESDEEVSVPQKRQWKRQVLQNSNGKRHTRQDKDDEEKDKISASAAQKITNERRKRKFGFKRRQRGRPPKHPPQESSSSESEHIEVDDQPDEGCSNQGEQSPKNVIRPSRIQGALDPKLEGRSTGNQDALCKKNGLPLTRTQDKPEGLFDSRMTRTNRWRKNILEAVRQHQNIRKQKDACKEEALMSSASVESTIKEMVAQNHEEGCPTKEPVRPNDLDRAVSSVTEQEAVTNVGNKRKHCSFNAVASTENDKCHHESKKVVESLATRDARSASGSEVKPIQIHNDDRSHSQSHRCKTDEKDPKGVRKARLETQYTKGVIKTSVETRDTKHVSKTPVETRDTKGVSKAPVKTRDTKRVSKTSGETKDTKGLSKMPVEARDTKRVGKTPGETRDTKGVSKAPVETRDTKRVGKTSGGTRDTKGVSKAPVETQHTKGFSKTPGETKDTKGVSDKTVETHDTIDGKNSTGSEQQAVQKRRRRYRYSYYRKGMTAEHDKGRLLGKKTLVHRDRKVESSSESEPVQILHRKRYKRSCHSKQAGAKNETRCQDRKTAVEYREIRRHLTAVHQSSSEEEHQRATRNSRRGKQGNKAKHVDAVYIVKAPNIKVSVEPQDLFATGVVNDQNLDDMGNTDIVVNQEWDDHMTSDWKDGMVKVKKRRKKRQQQEYVIHETLTSNVPYVQTLDSSHPLTNMVSLDEVTVEDFHLQVFDRDNRLGGSTLRMSHLQMGPHYECAGIVKASIDLIESSVSDLSSLSSEESQRFRESVLQQAAAELDVADIDAESEVSSDEENDDDSADVSLCTTHKKNDHDFEDGTGGNSDGPTGGSHSDSRKSALNKGSQKESNHSSSNSSKGTTGRQHHIHHITCDVFGMGSVQFSGPSTGCNRSTLSILPERLSDTSGILSVGDVCPQRCKDDVEQNELTVLPLSTVNGLWVTGCVVHFETLCGARPNDASSEVYVTNVEMGQDTLQQGSATHRTPNPTPSEQYGHRTPDSNGKLGLTGHAQAITSTRPSSQFTNAPTHNTQSVKPNLISGNITKDMCNSKMLERMFAKYLPDAGSSLTKPLPANWIIKEHMNLLSLRNPFAHSTLRFPITGGCSSGSG